MKISAMFRRSAVPFLAVAFAASATAQLERVGNEHRQGFARQHLWHNLAPSFSTYYTPAQIRHAYGFDLLSTTGTGQKIAIVDAYGSANIQRDLNTFCTRFSLPQTTVGIYYAQKGPQSSNTGWAEETTLDVEWAHAVAPGATIMVVVARSAGYSDLLGAVDYAVAHGANVVSMSWGGSEFQGETSYDYHFNHPGVTFVASSGDYGEGVEWPAASPFVVGVGGTSLYPNPSGSGLTESAWAGSGGGISLYEQTQGFQGGWDTYLGGRGVPDVAYVADPNTGVLVCYNGRWYVFGGTSVGAPQWSALVALSNSQRTTGVLSIANLALYELATNAFSMDYLDVSLGNDGPEPDDYARVGYDLVTGLGAPWAPSLVPSLSKQ